eukprot:954933-Amphidinium_carterae.2
MRVSAEKRADAFHVATRDNLSCGQAHSEQANCVSGPSPRRSVSQQTRWIEPRATCDFCHDDVGGHISARPTFEKSRRLM